MIEDQTTSIESQLIPPALLKSLVGSGGYEKKKSAALEVTSLVKSFYDDGNKKDRITHVIKTLAEDFARSKSLHHRKGGLIGLAASAIGLSADIDRYLNLLIPPVLECFDDPEARVCFYACESLYNIAKVGRSKILRYFNQIFDGLCKLFSHVDVDVKTGANLLDRLIKDIVTETESFDIESFIPLLQKYIKRTKPYIRQLLVGWITVLNTVPDINMLDYLPDFLDGLFNMLSDGNSTIKSSSEMALDEFLSEIKIAQVIEFGPMIDILVDKSSNREKVTRHTAIIWLTEFISLGGTRLVNYYAKILGSVMHCISDQEPEIRQQTKVANERLLDLVKSTTEAFELNPLLHALTRELLSEHVTTRVAALLWINMLHEKAPVEINKSIGDLLPALLKAISDSADEVVLINLRVLARIAMDSVQFLRVLNALVVLFLNDRALLETRGALVIRKLCALLDSRAIYMSLASILNDKPDLEFTSLMVQTLNLILLTAPELLGLRKILKNSFKAGADPSVFLSLFPSWAHNPAATFSLCLLAQAYDLSVCLIRRFAEVDVTVGFLMQIDKLVQLLESPIFIRLRLQLLEVNARGHADLLKSLYGLLMLLPQSQAYKTLSDRLSTVSSLHMHIGFTGAHIGTAPIQALTPGSKYTSSSSSSSSSSASPTKPGSALVLSPPANSKTAVGKGGGSGVESRQSFSSSSNTSSGISITDYEELLRRFDGVQKKHVDFRQSVFRESSLLP